MLTTPTLISFLQLREGFRKHAYDDKHPNRELTEDTPIEGTLTIGYGTTEYPDGTKVKWNDTVSKQEALDYLNAYIRTEIEPVLENLIHVPLKGCQYDALGSCIYQFGAAEVSGWRLIRKINNGASWQEIALEWVDGTVMWQGSPLFWGRRIMELFMFFDLDWKAGDNVPAGTSVITALETMGMSDSKATADLNAGQLQKLEDFARDNGKVVVREAAPEVAKKATKVEVKNAKSPIPVDHIEYLDDEAKAEVKVTKVKNSQRGKGFAKKEVAKSAGVISVGGMIADQVGILEPAVKFASNYSMNTIGVVLGVTVIGSVIYWAYGEWQEKKGRDEATTLLG
jgi:GH24 family phage-related lysozyme (muramidase)/predicted GNAT family acetyltransferase